MEKKPSKGFAFNSLDDLSVNTIRFLACDAVEKANSGHPGMPMGDAPMAYALWTRFLRFNPKNPKWPGRDRFVLSAGHGSMLLYSLLHLTGYDMPLEELKNFRQWGSHTPGHPEYDLSKGIETTTGPLGQGFANGIGMAMAQRFLAGRYNKPGFPLFDYRIYAITSDGDMMEGVSNEAASMAGHLGLGNIVYLYSDNKITIEGSTDLAFTEDVGKRFEAMNWHVQKVSGNDMPGISAAIQSAIEEQGRPSLIMARTNIGFGSPSKQDTSEAHGAPLGKDDLKAAKERLKWPLEPDFHVPAECLANFREAGARGENLQKDWDGLFKRYAKEYPELAAELKGLFEGKMDASWVSDMPSFTPKDAPIATRSVSGKVLNAIAKKAPLLIGGSADLSPSNNTFIKGFENFQASGPGRNIHFGVREHAMGSILNGIALSGMIIPYGGTFLIFSDYMRPPMRLAALMGLHVIYVFTHDSIGLGEDGPTHQPIEQLSNLRAVPNLTVMRPADAVETVGAWRHALQNRKGPVALVLTRQNLPVLDRDKYRAKGDLDCGGYVIADPAEGDPECVIIATGSEVHLAVEAFEELAKRGVRARVVSMPSCEVFDSQDETYRASVLPPNVKTRVTVEAGVSHGWHKYAGDEGCVISIEHFGASAPYKTLFEKFGITVDAIVSKTLSLVNRGKAQ